jgi:CheY-like chemotaxis protein
VPVEVDAARFAQVVANLLTNASKYSDPGTQIEVTAQVEDGHVTLRVSDQGIGIAPAMMSSIFELFVQQPQSIDRAEGGLGLGLAIVRSLVELHGGSVEAHSEGLGRGSQFSVRLPLAADRDSRAQALAREAHAAAAPARPLTERNGTRVLVVDDNEDAATLVAELLEALGYEVGVAHDGPSALALAPELKPDICLLDIGLPVMDGYELAGHLRALPGLPQNLRIVALTGYGTQSDRQRAIHAGFNEHLVKPVDLAALKRVVVP